MQFHGFFTNSVEFLAYPSSETVQFTSFFQTPRSIIGILPRKSPIYLKKSGFIANLFYSLFENLSYWYQKTMIAPNLSVHASAISPNRGDGKP